MPDDWKIIYSHNIHTELNLKYSDIKFMPYLFPSSSRSVFNFSSSSLCSLSLSNNKEIFCCNFSIINKLSLRLKLDEEATSETFETIVGTNFFKPVLQLPLLLSIPLKDRIKLSRVPELLLDDSVVLDIDTILSLFSYFDNFNNRSDSSIDCSYKRDFNKRESLCNNV